MRIYVQIKSAGGRKSSRTADNPFRRKHMQGTENASGEEKETALNRVPYDLPDGISTLGELLTELVKIEVGRYNEKGTDRQLIPFLTGEEIEEQAETGKVGFGRIYSDRKADEKKAVENACQCFSDGLVRVFRNEEELMELDGPVRLREGDCLTLIRLTFLSGRLW